MQKIVCNVGPTAVGKTDLAFKTAHNFNGELVSADSVQVFEDLDIISGKDIPKGTKFTRLNKFSSNLYNIGYYRYKNIPIYLLDIVKPTQNFSVSQFQDFSTKIVQYIGHRNKLPVIVGGIGLYVSSLFGGIETSDIKPDLKLRKQLESLTIEKLQEELGMLNPEKLSFMNNSDLNNKRRLIRGIEILSSPLPTTNYKRPTKYQCLIIGLLCEREILKQRIDKRVEERLKQGALEEAKNLFENYEKLSQQVKDANGYKQLFSFLKNEIDMDEAIYRWKISEYKHAKNQMTWFKKYGNVSWFDISKKGFEKEIEKRINDFLEL